MLKKKVVFHKKLIGSITSMGSNMDEDEEDIGFDMNGGDDTEFQINDEEDENINLFTSYFRAKFNILTVPLIFV